MSLPAGTRLGPYEVLSPLGAGGMGEVYRARDTRLEREVAVKVLAPELLADEGARKQFRREALALARLNHPNIAHVHDVVSEGGIDALVMELVPGESLSERLDRGPLPKGDVLRFGRELAAGLAAAHGEGVVHCDLKPANLRLSKDGVLKILDFGLARLRQPAAANDVTASLGRSQFSISGTLPYMAPEQLRAEPPDARTDVWGAGAVLYELATGARPFPETVQPKLIDAILNATPVAPSSRNPAAPPDLDRIVLRCLEREPGRRYASASDLLADLTALGAPQPAAASRAGRRIGLLSGVAFLVIAAAVATWQWRRAGKAPGSGAPGASGPKTVAVLPFVNMTESKENEYLGDGISEEVINVLAKDGRLQVVSRTSAFSFKGQNLDAREIGKRLNAGAILEGSVRQAGKRLRVTAQMIDTSTGYHLWSETFDREAADIFAIQDEISRAIVAKLTPSSASGAPTGGPPTTSLEAYDEYLRGRHAMQNWDKEGLREAEGHFEKAVRLDPDFGAAWAVLAETAIMQYELHDVRSREDAFARASDAARRAVAGPRPDPGAGHAALAHILVHEGKWAPAEDEVKKAIAANPGNPIAHEWYGYLLWVLNRFPEAEPEMRRAIELDPLSGPFYASLGACQLAAGQPEEAARSFERAEQLGETEFSVMYGVLVKVQLRRFDEALRGIEASKDLQVGRRGEVVRAYVLAAAGRTAEARAALARIEKDPEGIEPIYFTGVVLAYAALKDPGHAAEWIRKAGPRAQDMLSAVRSLPEMRAIAADPRMREVVKPLGFPD
jgi:eukaryotic-like serine/threonine-protein kinase